MTRPQLADFYSAPVAGFYSAVDKQLGLSNIIAFLHEEGPSDWSKILSHGELQRLALTRAILLKPDWLYLDEPFTSMNREQEQQAVSLLQEKLPSTAIICVTHSASLDAFFKSYLTIEENCLSWCESERGLAAA
jgi:vitamin B12/bleomycin/antimicrobial peptide transport system ATP-binding/permease protein